MREIRKLNNSNIDDYTDIAYNAYPSFKNLEEDALKEYKNEIEEILNKDPDVTFYGMFEEEKLIAVIRLFDFKMNCFGKILPVSGAGFLGVHLMHKKEKAAKEMMDFYEEVYKKRNIPIGMLLPFRPDFYKRMGYGIGTKINQYRLPPSRIPAYYGESDLRYVKDDFENLLACHERIVKKTHGMIMKIRDEIIDLKNDPYNKIIGNYDKEGKINGYIVFKFENGKEGNYTVNNIYVKELIYENIDVLKKILGFLRKQDDQANLVIFNTMDENFHYLFDNPLNDSLNYIPYGYIESNTQGVGAMYKIFNVKEGFKQLSHRDYNNVNINVRFLIKDNMTEKTEEVIVNFVDGSANLNHTEYDVSMKIKRSDFSSLFLGCTSVKGLYNLGLLEIDKKEFLRNLDLLFYKNEKPVCYTDF